MYLSKLLSASMFLLVAVPVGAQVMVGSGYNPAGPTLILPAGSPIPSVLPPGYGGLIIGGATFISNVAGQAMGIGGAAQDAARAAAAGGGAVLNYQFLVPLDGLNVNVLQGGVALPADAGSPILIQSGSSLMIGSTPPVVGGSGSAKPTTTNSDGGKSESKSGDSDNRGKQNEKVRGEHTASPGKPPASGPTASVPPSARPTGGGGASDPVSVTPPEVNAPKDPTLPPQEVKPGDPRAPDPSLPPVVSPTPPSGGPKPPTRPVDPSPTAKPRTVVATPVDVRTRDPVAERIDQGMERDIGTTPPIMHRIDSLGVSTPECLGASREGLACQ